MRGALFDSLASSGVSLARVLDLYAGSGALGIEALSRGAIHCDFVERDRGACALIRENLEITGFTSRAGVHCVPVAEAGSRLTGPYTLVLADPPYVDEGAASDIDHLIAGPMLSSDAVLALEGPARSESAKEIGGLEFVKILRHGGSAVSIYTRR
jgi:16S rRNA (guanine966-N2)-methyltransferase